MLRNIGQQLIGCAKVIKKISLEILICDMLYYWIFPVILLFTVRFSNEKSRLIHKKIGFEPEASRFILIEL